MGNACSGEQPVVADEKEPVGVEPIEADTAETKVESKPALEPEPEKESVGLTVKVVGCRGLRNADWTWIPGNDVSDAYVLGKIDGKEVLRTQVIKNTLEPLFNEEFELKGKFSPMPEQIEFEIWDKDMLKPDDLLGRVKLPKAQFESRGFNGEVALEEAGMGIKAFLKVMIKLPGYDYPAGPSGEFKITLEKAKGGAVGIDTDQADPSMLFITGGFEGAAKKHNDLTDDPFKQLKKNQYIVQVNNVKGDTKKMMKELKDAAEVTLIIRRPTVFTIAVKKQEKFGTVMTNAPTSAYISKIADTKETTIKTWNSAHKDKEVKAGDRVVQVNGTMGTGATLTAMMNKNGPMQVLICRPHDVSKITEVWNSWF